MTDVRIDLRLVGIRRLPREEREQEEEDARGRIEGGESGFLPAEMPPAIGFGKLGVAMALMRHRACLDYM